MNIYKLAISFISIFAVCNICLAEDADLQAASFHQIYTSICGKSINDLDALRQKLSNVPEFPPEKAAGFLNGNAGSAWPIPDKTGLFVLALPDNKNTCSIYARRASAEKVEEKFIEFVSVAPKPLLVKKVSDMRTNTPNNGEIHTL